jgi:hypothetical protein
MARELANVYRERKAAEKAAEARAAQRPARQASNDRDWQTQANLTRALNKAAVDQNQAHFYSLLANRYGTVGADKTQKIPGHILDFAVNLEEDAREDPIAAFKRVVGNDTKIADTANKWPGYVAYQQRELEKARGRKLNDVEIKELVEMGKTDPGRAAKIIGHFEQQGAKPWQPGPGKRGRGLWHSWEKQPTQQPPELTGTVPAGTPGAPAAPARTQPDLVQAVPNESVRDYIARANPRNDQLSSGDVATRYNRSVDESMGPGVMNYAAKILPVRELIDPNSPMRRAGRSLMEAIGGGGQMIARVGQDVAATLKQDRDATSPAPPQIPRSLVGITPGLAQQAAQAPYGDLRGAGGLPAQPLKVTPPITSSQETYGPMDDRMRRLGEGQ